MGRSHTKELANKIREKLLIYEKAKVSSNYDIIAIELGTSRAYVKKIADTFENFEKKNGRKKQVSDRTFFPPGEGLL